MYREKPKNAPHTASKTAQQGDVPFPMKHRIDAIDIKILTALQQNGRISNVDLAAQVGISPPPCLRRKQELEEQRCILGYYADVDEKRLGFEVSAFIFVGLVSQADGEVRAFEEAVRSWQLVREAYSLSGSIDFLMRCVAPDLRTFQAFVTGTVMKSPKVLTVRTALSLNLVKNEAGVPFELLSPHSRSSDVQIGPGRAKTE